MSPVAMGVPDRTKDREFAHLKEFQAKLDGKPLVVSISQTQCESSLILS